MEGNVHDAERRVSLLVRRTLAALLLVGGLMSQADEKDQRESVQQEPEKVSLDRLVFTDVEGKEFRLTAVEGARFYVLAFITNTCPIARRYTSRLVEMEAQYHEQGVRFIGVNVGFDETLEEIKEHARDFGVTFPLVKDSTGDATRALGMTRTPEIAVLDVEGQLKYRGRVDDQYRLGGVKPNITSHDLRDALDALLAGKPVERPRVPAEGCVITLPEKAGKALGNEG